MRLHYPILLTLSIGSFFATAQKKAARYFDNTIVADSASTLMIPIKYSHESLALSKVSLDEGFYANIIFYDFTKDESKKLFEKDTYIVSFHTHHQPNYYFNHKGSESQMTSKWFFYLVKNTDTNQNGHIDSGDPSILYVSDRQGNQVKALTTAAENIMGLELFEKQHFLMVKMQRDTDGDHDFRSDDRDFYYQKLDLANLSFGKKIEAK